MNFNNYITQKYKRYFISENIFPTSEINILTPELRLICSEINILISEIKFLYAEIFPLAFEIRILASENLFLYSEIQFPTSEMCFRHSETIFHASKPTIIKFDSHIAEKEFEYHNTLRTVKHICKSHKPTHHQNLQKSLPFQPKKEKIKNFLPFKKI